MDKQKMTNLLIGAGMGLVAGLIVTFIMCSNLNKTLDNAKKELGTCYTVGSIVEKVKLNVEDEEVKKAIKEIDSNLKVCLSEDYANKLEESLKDVDLSEYSSEDLMNMILGNSNIQMPEIDYNNDLTEGVTEHPFN